MDRPPGSVALTVTRVVPTPTASSTMFAPPASVPAVTIDGSAERASSLSGSPSGSSNKADPGTELRSPNSTVSAKTCPSGKPPTETGARFGVTTVTRKRCATASPARSLAVTVTVAVPSATPTIVSVLPDSDTETTPAADDATV